ncbi:DUF6351 family protein [Haloechinothrix salitolerans]|uniref:DUF6351 family protein n=1 Tax=Haloechinothrix salitolerans TaxID=926830 RepID=A0ABW2BUT8_9PSEU
MGASSWMSRIRRRGAVLMLAAALAAGAGGLITPLTPASAAPDALRIDVLSNRADLISGSDALVAIALPEGVDPSQVRVRLGNRDVTDAFAPRPNGQFAGLVTGLPIGESTLRATGGGASDDVVITNHPNGGPVFSGPHVQPWQCQDGARDAKCNQSPEYTFRYKSTNPAERDLKPYDPDNPPSDVAMTTTDQGVEVPFIVRQEIGYQDRDQYKILQLFQPGEDWQPWAPQEQWNHKVLVPHGGNCGTDHAAGEAPLADYSGTFNDVPGYTDSYVTALGRGFAVMSTALNNLGHNCNLLTQAESLVMAKERLVEQYGTIRYTIGTGCSGGSIVQNTVANAYPGVYQGLVTTCSYPDAMSTLAQFLDYHLLRRYFEDPTSWAPGVVWSPTQFGQVEGHISHLNAVVSDELFTKRLSDPTYPCEGVPDTEPGDEGTRYDPDTNPGGVRCFILDYMINALGPRDPEVWTPREQRIGRGFAGIPAGNEGVQYGLEALRRGEITAAQFVDLNAKVGTLTIDGKPTPGRYPGDRPALDNAYRSGLINAANNLDGVAIINHGGPDPGAAHDYGHAFWTKSRLEREQGHTRNMVMWFGEAPLIGNPDWATEAMLAMDEWLSEVEADTSASSLPDKIVANRPDDLQDRCSNLDGLEDIEVPGVGTVCERPEVQTRYSTPRGVAGGPVTNDVNACELKPLRRLDYYPISFTDAQWQRLTETFPNGVCDYSEPGVGQGDTRTWQTYQDTEGDVVYGGTSLGARPAGSGVGTMSASFLPLLDQ